MGSPLLQPAHGSSRTTGGLFRGKKDTFRFADAEDDASPTVLPAQGTMMIYINSSNPLNFKPGGPNASVIIPAKGRLGVVVKDASMRYPSLQSKSSISHFWNLT